MNSNIIANMKTKSLYCHQISKIYQIRQYQTLVKTKHQIYRKITISLWYTNSSIIATTKTAYTLEKLPIIILNQS